MAANFIDTEIRKYLPMLGIEEKKSLLDTIKAFLHIPDTGKKNNEPKQGNSSIDYSLYHFPTTAIKFNRDEINER